MQVVSIYQEFNAPVEEVFNYLSDHEKFGDLLPGDTRRIKAGSNPAEPNGLGSVRLIKIFPVELEETITDFVPNKLIEYRISNESLLRNHLGKMEFEERNNKTILNYTIEFESKIKYLGSVIRFGLEETLLFGLKKLAEKYE
ncbi:MAG: SRPBCC family protein [Chitinophagales bacterium]|nr:SRPBCC family protein [Chitinophagales bacterium]